MELLNIICFNTFVQFGVESKLELNYWWAKGTMPLPDNTVNQIKQSIEKSENVCEKLNKDTDHVNNQNVNVEEKIKKCDLDVELLSPNHSDNVETDGMTLFYCIFSKFLFNLFISPFFNLYFRFSCVIT